MEDIIRNFLIAKNYLTEEELKLLNNLVSGYFDFAEFHAMKHRPMYMKDYLNQLNKILDSLDVDILESAGTISHELAINKAKGEFEKYEEKTLSPIEEEYLKSINELDDKLKRMNKE